MMTARQHKFIAAALLVAILFSALFNVPRALADGEIPTEPPVATQAETEEQEELTAEPTAVPDEPTATPAAVESETPQAPSTGEPGAQTNNAVAGVLSDVPEDTSLVVLDEDGQPLALGTQETAEAIVNSDPVWCPAGISPPTPGLNGCSASYASITDLLTAMRTSPAAFDADGTIFLEALASPGFTTPLILDDSASSLDTAFATLRLNDLTIKGGWNPGSGTVTGTQTLFGVDGSNEGYILIGSLFNPWVGNIRLEDIEVRDISVANSITIYTSSGSILFDDVDVAEQTGDHYLAYLHSISGNITVGNGSNFDGNDSGTGVNESRGFYAQTGSGSITINSTSSSYTFRDNEGTDPAAHNGATLIASTVTLNNVISRANDGNGIEILGASLVTLNNVTSSVNQVGGSGNGLSGILIQGTGTTIVNLHGGTFAKNGRYGIELFGGTLVLHSDPVCPTTGATANGLGCYNVTPVAPVPDSTPPVITPAVSGTLGGNGWYVSNVIVNWIVVDNESLVSSTSGCGTVLVSSDTSGVTFTCTATSDGGTASESLTIKRDVTPPVSVAGAPDRAPDSGGAYDHPVDIVFTGSDATSGIATCSTVTYSGPNGDGITVGGSCTDQAGNTSHGVSSAFDYNTAVATPSTPAATPPSTVATPGVPGSGSSGSSSSGSVIPLTGSNLIDLGCNSAFWAFGVKLSFMELCNLQATVDPAAESDLPAALPDGFTFVLGLDMNILEAGQALESLPAGSGIQLDFPVGAGEYAVLFWDEAAGEWVEVASPLDVDEVADALISDAGDGLYRLTPDIAGFLQVLTTDKTGVFVLVRK